MTNPGYKVSRKRKRDHHLWNLIFSRDEERELNPLQKALLGNQQKHAPPPPPP